MKQEKNENAGQKIIKMHELHPVQHNGTKFIVGGVQFK